MERSNRRNTLHKSCSHTFFDLWAALKQTTGVTTELKYLKRSSGDAWENTAVQQLRFRCGQVFQWFGLDGVWWSLHRPPPQSGKPWAVPSGIPSVRLPPIPMILKCFGLLPGCGWWPVTRLSDIFEPSIVLWEPDKGKGSQRRVKKRAQKRGVWRQYRKGRRHWCFLNHQQRCGVILTTSLANNVGKLLGSWTTYPRNNGRPSYGFLEADLDLGFPTWITFLLAPVPIFSFPTRDLRNNLFYTYCTRVGLPGDHHPQAAINQFRFSKMYCEWQLLDPTLHGRRRQGSETKHLCATSLSKP